MTNTGKKPKFWRPRFSPWTLVVFVTLVCCYFGAWEATKTFGVPAVEEFAETADGARRDAWYRSSMDAESPFPFFVRVSKVGMDYGSDMGTDDVAEAFAKALRAGAVPVVPPKQKPWGQTVGDVRDPNGFLVEICSPIG